MMLVQSLGTLFSCQWLWRKKILNFINIVLLYHYLLLQKGRDTSFRGLGNPLPDVPSVDKIGSVVINNEYYHFFQSISALLLLSPV